MTGEISTVAEGRIVAGEDPLAAIRRHTAGLHERVEASVRLEDRLVSRETYCQLLRQYLGLYVILESALFRLGGEAGEVAHRLYRPKVELLRRDLECLQPGLPMEAAAVDPAIVPDLTEVSALFGALYVVEGSALGGRFIARRVEQELQLTAENGAAFFAGDGEATGAQWRRFTAALNQEVSDPAMAAEAACGMFLAFECSLNRDRR